MKKNVSKSKQDHTFKILVLDDYFFARERLRTSLARRDRQVDAVRDGSAALAMLTEANYDLFVTDLFHEGVDGLSLIRTTKQKGLATKIVVTSSNHSLESITSALEAGADDYLLKPYRLNRLKDVVERLQSTNEVDNGEYQRYINEKLFGDFESNRRVSESAIPGPATPEAPHGPSRMASSLREMAKELPQSYEQRASALADEARAFRQELAAQLAPSLNARLQSMPHDTYEGKKSIAKWINDELRRFDLAIKCPKTGEPSLLHADTGNHPEIGRFQLEHKTAEGKRSRSLSTPELPHLELMEAAPRREALAEWHERVASQPRGAKRG